MCFRVHVHPRGYAHLYLTDMLAHTHLYPTDMLGHTHLYPTDMLSDTHLAPPTWSRASSHLQCLPICPGASLAPRFTPLHLPGLNRRNLLQRRQTKALLNYLKPKPSS